MPVRMTSKRVENISAWRKAAKDASVQYDAWAVIMSANKSL